MHNPESVLENESSLRFGDTNSLPNLSKMTLSSDNQQKKRTCWIVNFVFLADRRVKLKECEKNDKYQNLAREMKKLYNMKVTVIPIVIGALGTVTKGLIQELEDLEMRGWVETI